MSKNEQGFVLVTALLIMLVLTIIGIAGSLNTSIELLIAGNERTSKESFFNSDGGAEVAQEMLEQNLACITGFKTKDDFPSEYSDLNGGTLIDNLVYTQPYDFWRNFSPISQPSDTSRDMFYPWESYNKNVPHTNITVAGSTKLTTGSAIQMAAGYEGRGKGIGSGGAYLVYEILSQHLGKNNSESLISVYYRHIIGQEGSCYY